MATQPSMMQIAPGEEAGHVDFDAPYIGASPGQHQGMISLNEAFQQGAVFGYYAQYYDPH